MYKNKILEKRKVKALAFLIILFGVSIFLLNYGFSQSNLKLVDTNNSLEDNFTELKISTVVFPISIDDTVPGSDWDFAVTQTWCTGSGTSGDPYLLENLEIDCEGADNGIFIVNSEAYFTIRDCTIYNSGSGYHGIYLNNVSNGIITMNNCSNNYHGIYIDDSSHNNIIGNTIYGSGSGTGIVIYTLSHNNTIDGNFLEHNYHGLYLYYSDNNTISGNTVIKNRNYGIWFSTECDLNYISGNIVSDHTEFAYWGADGIYIRDGSDNNTITGNTVNNNAENGINIEESYFNELSGNIIRNNSLDGIYLVVSHYSIFSENSVSDNILNGIELDASEYNVISKNMVFDNGLHGIYLGGFFSDDNNITANMIYSNYGHGINLDDECQSNNIWDNEIYENGMNGINLLETGFNDIYGNVIRDNNDTGIYATSLSYFNLFHENFFHRNAIHAIDDGFINDWNNTVIGNYWDNHTGPDTTPKDGIVDVPYTFIGGSVGSIDYLPIVDDASPIITIKSPNTDDAFDDAPSFDLTVSEDYLWNMWYTLDGGANNYFTDFTGTIDQVAWDALPDGNITLTFYANDKAENVDSAEVIVSKDTQAPVIVITKPAPDKKLSSAFRFELEVADPHLDKIWYSLDGGVTNFTADTPAEKIEKAAWSAVAKGDVTITFYASDTLGHVASESVTIKKVEPTIGLDYVTTSILILAISGVAIIAIIAKMRSKKRIL